MPKIKTRKSLSKRIVKVTKKGKILRRKTVAQHLAHRKTKRTKKESGKKITVSTANSRLAKALAPYK